MQAIAWDLLTQFAGLGHRVTALTTEIASRHEPFVASGVKVVPIVGAPAEKYSRAWWRGSRAFASSKECNDVDGVLSISTAAAGMTQLRKSHLRVPFLCQLHGTSWGEAVSKWRSGRWLERCKSFKNLYAIGRDATIFSGFDELIVVGDSLKKQFSELPTRWVTRGVPVKVIRNGVDARFFRFNERERQQIRASFGFSPSAKVALFSARLHAQKGAAEAIRAVSVLSRKGEDIFLLVVGGGPEDGNLKELVGALNLDSRIQFMGVVDRTRIPGFLSAADLLVFPTLRVEGLPMNVLEALGVGLPCVCSSSLAEVFGEIPAIVYTEPNNTIALSEALERGFSFERTTQSQLPSGFSLECCAASYIEAFSRHQRSKVDV